MHLFSWDISFVIGMTIISACLICCTDDDAIISNEELIFTNSYPVNIPAYTYTDSLGSVYAVQGDTNYPLHPDTLNSSPTLAWDSILFELVSAAIFIRPVDISGGEIKNVTDIVWQWHSGMDSDKNYRIKYFEGKNVSNGEIDYQNPAQPLSEGKYYWGVWGWGNTGIRILHSSRQREFYVPE